MKGFMEVNKDVSILEDHSAGSNAVTLLCTDGTATFYRKFAIGIDGEKLYNQIRWLQEHQKVLALPKIINVKKRIPIVLTIWSIRGVLKISLLIFILIQQNSLGRF